jgi:hypothetical protein
VTRTEPPELAVTTTIPTTLKATLEAATLSALEQALAPPPAQRSSAAVELELEADGEGTFTLTYKDRAVTAKKGFAKRPLVSARLGKGAWPLLREQLQSAVDEFPAAPELASRLKAWRSLGAADLDAVVAALTKLADGIAVRFDVAGAGTITLARGPVDEATRELVVGLDAAKLRALLSGAALSSLSASIKGDRSVGTAALAALGPVLAKLKL